jgi:hypothetical protein
MFFFLRFATLLLAALSLTMESAHLLELPQKLQYDANLYATVNTTLYRYFAVVGGIYQVGAIVAAVALTIYIQRRDRQARWTFIGTIFLAAAFGVWLVIVNPVNDQIAAAKVALPESIPSLWMQLRARWEFGHVAGFVLQLLGFSALLVSVLVSPQAPEPKPDLAPEL